MKKSSLGRRSSILGQGRLSNIDKSSIRNTAESKKSFIPKPTHSSSTKNDRASSVDRDGAGSSMKKDQQLASGLRRSRSFLDLNRNSTCQTPTQFSRRNTAGSCRKFPESTGRPSSMGAPKSARKESRPISEKAFQQEAQHKVQKFFMDNAPHLLDNGSIKPMTSAMFANLVQYLIQRYDKRIVINKTNLIEEILNICKMYNYRGKAEKSWLMTVNAPHSWPYVVSFLLWLVEITKCSQVFDVYEALYPERVEGDEAEGEDSFDFKLLVPRLLNGYRNGNSAEEMQKYLIEHKQVLGLDDEEQELLERQYSDLQKELFDSEDAQEQELLEALENDAKSLRSDITKTREYNYSTENYIASLNKKREERLEKFEEYENEIKILSEKQNELREFVSSQEMSPERKQEIEEKIASLHQEIRQLTDQIADYQDEVYKIDIDLVKNRNEFNKVIQAYNKEITVNLIKLPSLKHAQIEDTKAIHTDAKNGGKPFENVDCILKELRTSSKNRKRDKEMEEQQDLLSVQKKEDELTMQSEENDALISQHEQLTNEAIEIKSSMSKEKEQMRTALNEYHSLIKKKKEEFEMTKSDLTEEFSVAEKEYLKQKEEADKYVKKGLLFLDQKKEEVKKFDQELEEDTRKIFEETKQKMEGLLNK